MRLKIVFKVINRDTLFPFSYQPFINAWLYQLLGNSNAEFAEFLHNKGFGANNKQFKFFTFSKLYFHDFNIENGLMRINDQEVSLIVSAYLPEIMQHLFKSLFEQNAPVTLGNYNYKLFLQIKTAELLPIQLPTSSAKFSCLSPIAVGKKVQVSLTKSDTQYLSPNETEFGHFFMLNLIEKYHAAVEHNLLEPLSVLPKIEFKSLTTLPKQKLITIKESIDNKPPGKVRSYLFDFELKAPFSLLHLGYFGGFGRHNAMGFGMVKLLDHKTQ